MLRDGFRSQIEDHTAVRTNVTLRVLLAEWLAGHQVEQSTRASYALLIDKFILPALGDQTLPVWRCSPPGSACGLLEGQHRKPA